MPPKKTTVLSEAEKRQVGLDKQKAYQKRYIAKQAGKHRGAANTVYQPPKQINPSTIKQTVPSASRAEVVSTIPAVLGVGVLESLHIDDNHPTYQPNAPVLPTILSPQEPRAIVESTNPPLEDSTQSAPRPLAPSTPRKSVESTPQPPLNTTPRTFKTFFRSLAISSPVIRPPAFLSRLLRSPSRFGRASTSPNRPQSSILNPILSPTTSTQPRERSSSQSSVASPPYRSFQTTPIPESRATGIRTREPPTEPIEPPQPPTSGPIAIPADLKRRETPGDSASSQGKQQSESFQAPGPFNNDDDDLYDATPPRELLSSRPPRLQVSPIPFLRPSPAAETTKPPPPTAETIENYPLVFDTIESSPSVPAAVEDFPPIDTIRSPYRNAENIEIPDSVQGSPHAPLSTEKSSPSTNTNSVPPSPRRIFRMNENSSDESEYIYSESVHSYSSEESAYASPVQPGDTRLLDELIEISSDDASEYVYSESVLSHSSEDSAYASPVEPGDTRLLDELRSAFPEAAPPPPPQGPPPTMQTSPGYQRPNLLLSRATTPSCDCRKFLIPSFYVDLSTLTFLPGVRRRAGSGLTEISQYWKSLIPFILEGYDEEYPCVPPLHGTDKILPREGPHEDFRAIPWENLLAGENHPPRLDYSASEHKCLRRIMDSDISLRSQWDVDSFIAHVTTLAVHKHAFNFSYCPPFLQRITQNQRILINGYKAETLKQLRIGSSCADKGYGYNTHVLFPHMKRSSKFESTYVDNARQRIWIDRIILPALQEIIKACKITLRHPQSWKHAYGQAHSSREDGQGSGHGMDAWFPIPARYLASFWREVLVRANGIPEFRNPTLVLSAHGLKSTATSTDEDPSYTRRDFLNHLEYLFDLSPEILPPREAYLDLGLEESPEGPAAPSVTLLWKESCLQAWKDLFDDPDSNAHCRTVSLYPFMATRDAASMSVEIGANNSLRLHSDCAYQKGYNIIKDLWTTLKKDILPFCNTQFEALGLQQSELDHWASINRRGTDAYGNIPAGPEAAEATQQVWSKARLIESYSQVKQRIAEAIEEALQNRVSCGVRQEFRITLLLFQQLDFSSWTSVPLQPIQYSRARLDPTMSADNIGRRRTRGNLYDTAVYGSSAASAHRPFYILDTADVLEFISCSTNRWLLPIEALIAQSRPAIQKEIAPVTSQRLHSNMISVLFRILRLTFGGVAPEQFPRLWLDEWKARRPRPGRPRDGAERRFGLNLRSIFTKYGIISLPRTEFLWENLPVLPVHVAKRIQIKNAFQGQFKIERNIASRMDFQDRVIGTIRDRLRDAKPRQDLRTPQSLTGDMSRAFRAAIEVALQIFIRRVWELLWRTIVKERRFNNPAHIKDQKRQFLRPLSDREQLGLAGLSYDMVQRLIGSEPHISLARLIQGPEENAPAPARKRNFVQYHSSSGWVERFFALFGWNDGNTRTWDNENFRTFTRQIHHIIGEELGPEYAKEWFARLCRLGARYIWIIPHYDISNLSVPYKAGGASGRWPELQNSSWFVARLNLNSSLFHCLDRQGRRVRKRRVRRSLVGTYIKTSQDTLMVVGYHLKKRNRFKYIPKNYKKCRVDPRFHLAEELLESCELEDAGDDETPYTNLDPEPDNEEELREDSFLSRYNPCDDYD
ncbi:MAG: hypothetical protein LQ350_008558 [Teloschistes chrysophthalmus]|nr:MAG: hypothetical protein LQ350_008558 [Niorma chrysophthalma]